MEGIVVKESRRYGGLDRFRLIAAFFVVAIHTSPLASISDTADFALTRVVGRVAVPFFFMATGFFLLPNAKDKKLVPDQKRMLGFLKKTAILYGAASLLYLPVIVYAGGLGEPDILSLLKDIVFDGTFYHLWYFPAAILGALLLWGLLQSKKSGLVLGIALGLYLIGLLGDSYYGVTQAVAPLKTLYDGIFACADYTRNGLFFAPIFLLLGGMMGAQKQPWPLRICLPGFGVSLALLFVEAFLLRAAQWQRHDSMYILLLPCMVFLFQCLLHWSCEPKKSLRTFSLLLYVIHPMIVVCIRGFARLTGMRAILVDNHLIHFIAVLSVSCALSMAVTFLWEHRKIGGASPPDEKPQKERAWLEVDLRQLCDNALALQGVLPEGCDLMAVVKANAYGHGAVQVSRALNRVGITNFAVATLEEGIQLRKAQVKGDILILGYTSARCAPQLYQYDLIQSVTDYTHAKELNETGLFLKVHIQIDTGMHRLGEDYRNVEQLNRLFQLGNLRILGIYTHLCASNSQTEQDVQFTKLQKQRFDWLLKQLVRLGHCLPKAHIQSSYGVLCYPDWQYDYARVGIALYGALSNPDDVSKLSLDLHPTLSWRTRIVQIRDIKKGDTIGYGGTFRVERDTRVAVLSVGYGDGLPRTLSNGKGQVLIGGSYAKILGPICMDLCMVDVTDIPTAQVGESATLIGSDGMGTISAEQMAWAADTITNELFSRLSTRLERIYI